MRKNSSGTSLNIVATRISCLAFSLPQLDTIAFNGGTAARLGLKVLGEHASRYRIVSLPSSSPAYTLAYEAKLQQWKALHAAS